MTQGAAAAEEPEEESEVSLPETCCTVQLATSDARSSNFLLYSYPLYLSWVSMMSLSLTALCPTTLAVEARGALQGGNYTYHSLCLSQEGAQMFICAVSPLRASCAGTLEGGGR